MMDILGDSPYDFVMSHEESLGSRFVHRTFNSEDFKHFIKKLKHIYTNRGGLQQIFIEHQTDTSLQPAIHALNEAPSIPHLSRTKKENMCSKQRSVARELIVC
jgi:hypothetical protein